MPESGFDPSLVPPDYYDAQIAEQEGRVVALSAELELARERLEWWRKGRALYARDSGGASPDADPEAKVTELVPSSAALASPGTKPSLRQAILRVMLDRQTANGLEQHWRSKEVIAEVTRRGWLPGGSNPDNLVRRMLRAMAEDEGPLVKPEYGTFALAPSIRDSEYSQLPVGGRMR